MSDSQVVAATLARARRRVIAATFVRWVFCALAAGVIAMVLGAVLTGQRFEPGRPLLAIGAVACTLAAIAAAWRRPTLAQTAAALDRGLGLSDLAIAAYSLRDSTHPAAQLVVRDARRRLGAASLPQVLPMPRRLATWTSGASLAAVLLGLLAGGERTPAGSLVPAGGTGRIVSGGGPDSLRQAASGSAATEGAERSGSRPQPDQRRTPRASQDPGAPLPSSQGTPETGAARRQQSGALGAGASSDTAAQMAGQSGNAGRGSAGPQGAARAVAGGVQQGTVRADASPGLTRRSERAGSEGPTSPLDAPVTPDAIREATQRAETALSRDEIPPRMKPVVRRYFQSLQSESGR